MTAATTWDFADIEAKIDYAENNYQTLISNYAWDQKTITFSFPTTAFAGTGSYLPPGESLQYTAFLQSEINLAITVFEIFERFLDIDFVYDPTGNGEMKIGKQNMTAGGYASYPSAGSPHAVLVGEDYAMEPLGYGIQVLIHEVGHSLGLEHSFADNSPLDDEIDINTSTLMSYDRLNMNGGENNRLNSFMPMDILALQSIYGVSTKASDDVYVADNGISVIADYGGTDKIDISTQSYDAGDVNIVDLERGFVFYDRLGGVWQSTNYDRDTQTSGPWTERSADNGFYNIIIMPGSTIEIVVGSSVRDQIFGDSYANTITGGAGDDAIDGGGGIDIAIYSGFYSDYTIIWTGAGAYTIIDNIGDDGTDTLTSIETLRFGDRDFTAGTSPMLMAALDDRTVIVRSTLAFDIPVDAFFDPNGDALEYSATLTGGGALPSWLVFDAEGRSFSGMPGDNHRGRFSIVVTASDGYEAASDTFVLDILGRIGKDINGTNGANKLSGTAMAEKIYGRGGRDTILAGGEDDTIFGGTEADTLWGEAGADRFIYKSVGESMFKNGRFDYIMDFDRNERDRIDVSALDANLTKKGNQAFRFDKDGDGWGKTGQIAYWIDGGKTHVYGNVDKDKGAEFYLVLNEEINLRASDFIL